MRCNAQGFSTSVLVCLLQTAERVVQDEAAALEPLHICHMALCVWTNTSQYCL